ncbi:MAG TPA: polyhydroxyalkanoate depolymerase [Stellaceae bacterium]|jgi:poly(3-hydroxybutyrate) depolymerase|nr:polyhydroxyalkanoate depolymerase [Stellaceae bacterium]
MLYDAYQAQCDVLAPMRFFAEAAHDFLVQPWTLVRDLPFVRNTAAALDLFSHTRITHERPPFGIDSVVIDGAAVPVSEEAVLTTPFCRLLNFRKAVTLDQPKLLMVAPLSGHFSTLLRGTVETALPDHDVYLTDWVNARNVPLKHGQFGLDDVIELVIDFFHHLGPGAHVVAVCQPSVPVLAAVALMAAADDPCQPASMVLMGGPIDPAANPTEVNRFAQSHSLEWFERTVITTVPARYPGAFRRVYPGFLQLAGFISMNLDRHVSAHWRMFHQLVDGDARGMAPTRAFYDEYSAVMDLPADFYLQTIDRVFQRHDLSNGRFRVRGEIVDPGAIRRTALMTVEGERDDICAVGQTVAAHRLCCNLEPAKHTQHLQPRVGHYGVFNGRRWQTEIYPKVQEFIRAYS